MKKLFSIGFVVLVGLGLVGCSDDDNPVYDPAPATPQGVYSVTGDEQVFVYWNGIYEQDVKEYLVYRSLDAVTGYQVIATVAAQSNPNLDLLVYEYEDDNVDNGTKYYYAIASVDRAGQRSELSAENVFDTPRPQGTVVLFPNSIEPSLSGFNLETATQVYDTSAIADVYVDIFDGVYYLNVTSVDIDIQDMGYTSSFDEIGWSPEYGWSDLGYVELILGHTYVIWTADDHFAKMRMESVNASNSVTFQWAYQTAQGILELAPPANMTKPDHGPDYLRDGKDMTLVR
jgi:hypothetical protein